VPFSGRLIVDEERILDIIDRMRVAVPEEIKQARRVIQEKERILGEAHATVREAMSEQGLLQAVEDERRHLLQSAESEAALIRAGADDYARQVLEELSARVDKLQQSIRAGLDSLNQPEA
jgi:glutamyl-tRNA reductase